MNQVMEESPVIWKEPVSVWLVWAFALIVLGLFFYDALSYMVYLWNKQEEYGHGFLIPLLTLFFIWQQKNTLELQEFNGSWKGLLIIIPGLIMYMAGELATLYVITQYAFVVVLLGLVYSFTGKQAFKVIAIPLFLLFLMIPLPDFLYQNLSAKLQLVSTQIGVAVIRLFDISVFVEGNVIDLGVYKLQVVEACSGLRYLFPLMTLGFIAAYIFKQPMWKKVILFVSTIPITILMNSFRIGVIGITVEYWGIDMAEGFLHDFEGWIVFMSCMGLLITEMWVLLQFGSSKTTLSHAFDLELPGPSPENAEIRLRKIPRPFIASLVAIVLTATVVLLLPKHEEYAPDRKSFVDFPQQLGDWHGRQGSIEQIYIDALKFTDYIISDYVGKDGAIVNFYSAYYDSQKKGASAHSPRSCIPGGGWRIASLDDHRVDGASIGGKPLVVNRLVIKKGANQQLVYYWFQQRGRIITSEYLMKWYLLWDSITRHRTDGALIRLTTLLKPEQDISVADDRLEEFARKVSPLISDYVPE